MTLRWYQKQAVEAVWDYFRNKDGAPCVVLPTGSGKTYVIAELCRQVVAWGGRALVLAHVKELLAQSSEKLRGVVDSNLVGIYSAGMNERTTSTPIIVAGIQSVVDRVDELGEFKLIVVDEAHLIPPSGSGRYRRLIEAEKVISPKARLVGLTATPYRLGSGWIVKDRVKDGEDDKYDRILDSIVYEAPIAALISDGTLSSVIGIQATNSPDFSSVHTVRGDFDESEVEAVLMKKNVLASACQEIVKRMADRKKVVVFCTSRKASRECVNLLTTFQTEYAAELIDGETPNAQRDELVRRFKGDQSVNLLGETEKPLKYIVNVGVLTTGFDAPNIDCVVLLRPTKSLALYQQMIGRGLRTADDKRDCLVLDFGGNVDRHGPIDLATPAAKGKKLWKTCPDCGTVLALSVLYCACGHEWPRPNPPTGPRDPNKNVEGTASKRAILSDDEPPIVNEYVVKSISYEEHRRKDATPDDPSTLQIRYEVKGEFKPLFEWVCPEHEGWARKRFVRWWKDKSSVEPPTIAELAAKLANDGAIATPIRIKTTRKSGDRFPRIEWIEQSEIPDPATVKDSTEKFFSEFEEFEEFEEDAPLRCENCGKWNDYGLEDFSGKCRETLQARNGKENVCDHFVKRFVDKDVPF